MIVRKIIALIRIIVISVIIASIYGIINDQLTYTFSPEYYTKFKFYQFGLVDNGVDNEVHNPRIAVSIVGILATWWIGLIIGTYYGFISLLQKNYGNTFKTTFKAMMITLIITMFLGLIGLVLGYTLFKNEAINCNVFKPIIDIQSFNAVGFMHTLSYFGGFTGLIFSTLFIKKEIKYSKYNITIN